MPGVNLSRAEAKERSAHISVDSYQVTLDVTTGAETFYAKTVAKFSCNKVGYETFIDAAGKKIISATLNGTAVDASNFDGTTLFLKNLAAENELIIEIEAVYSKSGEGLQRSVDPSDNEVYLYSQGETAYIRHMYPCFDQPDLKATFTLTVTTPKHWEAISNNPVAKKTDTADAKTIWEFKTTPRIPTYITALIAGPYSHVHQTYKGSKDIEMGIYARKSMAKYIDQDEIFLITEQGFDYFEKTFGLAYPFEKYDQIAVVDFNFGAMENAGAVTFREDLLIFRSKVTERMYNARANTILHEMAHMWFGDMVTMSWWDDLWLNESFAEWSSYLALVEGTRFTNSWAGFNSERKNWAYRQDQLTSTHPIVADMVDIEAVNANFDGITYAKGASVLQQMVAHVGRENFIKGLQKYFAKHAWKNTTLQDLLVELEATSGRSLAPWTTTWLQTAGVNTLRPVLQISGDTYSSVAISQEVPAMPVGSEELRPHRLAVGLYDLNGEILKLRKSIELDVSGTLTFVPEFAGEKVADLLLINDRDLSYAKLRFDDRSIATLKAHLGKIEDCLARALCWSAAWDMLRDGEICATDFIEIALAGLKGEDDITTITVVLSQLNSAVENYSSDKNRQSLRQRVANAIGALLDVAQPASDMQLQLARGFATNAHSDSDKLKVRSMLDSKLNGLTVDADLRWSFVISLVERDAFTRAELDAELERDNTTTGALAHQLAIAAFPNSQAKSIAWDRAINEDVSTSIRSSLVAGFARPIQRDLLEVFVDKYFSALLKVWESKSYEGASKIVTGLYPNYIISQLTLDKTKAWLSGDGKDAPAVLRKLVGESYDSLERAVKVQKRDI